MATKYKRIITETEYHYVEEAFSEFLENGITEKKCPWCSEKLNFENLGSGHIIQCSCCEMIVTARGV